MLTEGDGKKKAAGCLPYKKSRNRVEVKNLKMRFFSFLAPSGAYLRHLPREGGKDVGGESQMANTVRRYLKTVRATSTPAAPA